MDESRNKHRSHLESQLKRHGYFTPWFAFEHSLHDYPTNESPNVYISFNPEPNYVTDEFYEKFGDYPIGQIKIDPELLATGSEFVLQTTHESRLSHSTHRCQNAPAQAKFHKNSFAIQCRLLCHDEMLRKTKNCTGMCFACTICICICTTTAPESTLKTILGIF